MAFAVRLMSGVSRAFNHVLSSSGPKLHLPLLQERSIFTSPALMAMPVKKKRKLDPQIVRAREERRKKRITKALKFVFGRFFSIRTSYKQKASLIRHQAKVYFFPLPLLPAFLLPDILFPLIFAPTAGRRPAVLTTEHLNFTNPAHLEIVVR